MVFSVCYYYGFDVSGTFWSSIKILNKFEHNCEDCGKSYIHASGLSRHKQLHKGKRYICQMCNKNYSDASTLKRHNCKFNRKTF